MDTKTASRSPGKVRWLIACDESGIHGAQYYGFGTLWMKYQRRGDFNREYCKLLEKYDFQGEVKWSKAGNKKNGAFYEALIKYFFKRQWMVFHCLVVRKGMVKKELHGSWDLARRKHFTMLLTSKMKIACRKYRGRDIGFRVYVDPIASSYDKAEEVIEKISNRVIQNEFGTLPVEAITEKNSKETPTIQLCDLLLGAVMDGWQKKATNQAKRQVQSNIAECLGWPDLRADTRPEERKFNIWYFYDAAQGKREIETRPVELKFPLP